LRRRPGGSATVGATSPRREPFIPQEQTPAGHTSAGVHARFARSDGLPVWAGSQADEDVRAPVHGESERTHVRCHPNSGEDKGNCGTRPACSLPQSRLSNAASARCVVDRRG
jgi:hypothetical protein